jgi:hypothetical protein
VEVLAHLVLVDDRADRDADLVGAGQPARADAGDDGFQQFVGGGQQVVAFAGAFGGQQWVAAGDQPLAGELGVADLGHVLGVEQRHLQRPILGSQFGDIGCT